MQEPRFERRSDAFRPFCAGLAYAVKRGVRLADGTVICPRIPALAAALPVLRSTGGNAAAKTLHSSAHRGMCTLSRCVASVPLKEQAEVFADASRYAQSLSKAIFGSSDV